MTDNNPQPQAALTYEKPVLVRVRLDVRASTLGVNCWNSLLRDMLTDNGCLAPIPTCAP